MEMSEFAEVYETHDNGGRPFAVLISGTTVKVKTVETGSELLEIPNVLKVFVGKSPLNGMTEFSGGYGPEFDGNSILLKVEERKYIHIGIEIFSFTSFDEIIEYVYPVGNSDVPYPYGVDASGNYYLVGDDVMLMGSEKLCAAIEKYEEPYNVYYDQSSIVSNDGTPSELYGVFEDIHYFYLGDQKRALSAMKRYDIGGYYDQLTQNNTVLFAIETYSEPGVKKVLQKEEFIQLLERFAEVSLARDIHDKVVIVPRQF